MIKPEPYRWILIGASVGPFLVSLTQTCFYLVRGDRLLDWGGPGIALLLVGGFGLLDGVVAWLANPPLFLSWIILAIGSRRLSGLGVIAAFVSFCLSLSFLLQVELVPDFANGGRGKIVGYGPGYWMWVGSIATALAGNITLLCLKLTEAPKKTLEQHQCL